MISTYLEKCHSQQRNPVLYFIMSDKINETIYVHKVTSAEESKKFLTSIILSILRYNLKTILSRLHAVCSLPALNDAFYIGLRKRSPFSVANCLNKKPYTHFYIAMSHTYIAPLMNKEALLCILKSAKRTSYSFSQKS